MRKLLTLAVFAALLPMADFRALGQGKVKEDVENAIKVLKTEKDAKQRVMATEDLARAAEIKASLVVPAIPVLVEAVKGDASPEVRAAAVRVLGLMEPEAKAVVPVLLSALDDKQDRTVRSTAAGLLKGFGLAARDAIPMLADIKKKEEAKAEAERDGELLQNVNDSLQNLQQVVGQAAAKHMETLRGAKKSERRLAAAQELMKLAKDPAFAGQPVAETLVDAMVRDPDVEVHKAIVVWLRAAKPDPKLTVAVLVKALPEDQPRNARLGAATVLGTDARDAKDAIAALSDIKQKEEAKPENERDRELLGQVGLALNAIQKAVKAQSP